MQGWRLGFLGIETVPSWLGEFEIEQFFRLSPSEIATVKTRRGNEMQLGLGLHIGFLRMSGRVLNSSDVIHWRILAFLGAQLQIRAPRVASLRALYPRPSRSQNVLKIASGPLFDWPSRENTGS